ncbi:ABC transporter permease [uncultured Ruegeria sp.]|uniref:ABC transporter permease n=1 Tax=uncultured Ruegeria sp. TaxID=259304 RepID=UPI00262B3CAF|nr:ABC transporter permease [uncultured Ruegeria sp.]
MTTIALKHENTASLAEDPRTLKIRLAKAIRRKRINAFLYVLPLFLFVFVAFALPMMQMARLSVQNGAGGDILHRSQVAMKDWTGSDLPSEEIAAALVADMVEARENRTIGKVATRVNYSLPGSRSVITGTARKAKSLQAPYLEALATANPAWQDPQIWVSIRRAIAPVTPDFYLAALDLERDMDGNVVFVEPERQIYITLFVRTLILSVLITSLCLLLGFPVAYLLASLPAKYANLLMILVLLPFWTALLVRTTAWLALLQSQGVINDIFVFLGLIGNEQRLQLIYNATGTVIAMTHILLPFTILPLYSVMKTISPTYVRAAESLGAAPSVAFFRVYLPQTKPGIAAGCLLVFILSIGFYITPALVGGSDGQLISNFIALHVQRSLNWGLAAALSTILLAAILILYWLFNKLVGIDKLKLG